MDYSFVTIWKLEAPLEAVWAVINEPEKWPEWWDGVVKVVTTHKGDAAGVGHRAQYTWRSILPYTLTFNSEVTKVEQYKCIEGEASGELSGHGKWSFSFSGGVTTVRYDWNVRTTKVWMNFLSPLLKPAFKWNHDVVMRRGGIGLARRINGKLISSE